MSEVLVRFDDAVQGSNGARYQPQAVGTIDEQGLWIGWIEFISATDTMRTERETTQPNRDDLMYWAQGLTHTYLEGALARALATPAATVVDPPAAAEFERPAPRRRVARVAAPDAVAVLDPFAVLREGEEILRDQLLALSRDQLANISKVYQLNVRVPRNPDVGELEEAVDLMVRIVSRKAQAA